MLLQRLTERLLELRDPEDGQEIILDVMRRERLYHGSALGEIPDILFFLAPGYGLSGGVGRRGTLVGPIFQKRGKQGTHRREGILLMRGPEIQKSKGEERFELADLTVTILYALNLPIPDDMDGQVIHRAFPPSFFEEHPPRFCGLPPPEEPKAPESLWESGEDNEAIRKRLAGLGYLD
jgi:predicted AlkP superfamily phosphohydrolase/phosphomutase